MLFKDYIANSRQKIAAHLKKYCDRKRGEELPQIFTEQKLIDSLESFALRGKLIRGTLFLFACEALGLEIDDRHMNVACAIEFMHSSLLVQDDIIDNDRLRRGSKTVFAQYEVEGEKVNAYDPYHYGISTAIVVADIAFLYAFELIADFDDPRLSQLLRHFAHEIYLVILAESADSLYGQTDLEPTKEDINVVNVYKTARYTFSLPFELAAIVSGTDPKTRKTLEKIGELSGIIFQLKDDEIGLFGDEDMVGKPIGSDIRENKKTLIRHLLFEKVDESDRIELKNIFGNKESGIQEINKVKNLYEKYSIQHLIDEETSKIMEKVWELFNSLKFSDRNQLILKELLEYNLSRSF